MNKRIQHAAQFSEIFWRRDSILNWPTSVDLTIDAPGQEASGTPVAMPGIFDEAEMTVALAG